MLTSPFWFDATLTLYRRWKNGEKLSHAHRKHAYQRLAQSGFSHAKVNLYLAGVNAVIILMIFLYRKRVILQIPLYFLSLLFLYYLIKQVDKRFPFMKNNNKNN
jgi:Fuc2NAc and GlcNAc transferase